MYLVSFKHAQYAQTFVDYMKTKGIIVRMESDAKEDYALFLDSDDENTLIIVKSALNAYLENPLAPHYTNASWQIGSNLIHRPSKLFTLSLPNIISVGGLTKLITATCVFCYMLLLLFGKNILLAYLGYPIDANYTQFWRYFTPVFIHFSLLHLVSNLVWWWYLGGMIEKYRGIYKLLEILILAAILGNYATAEVSGPYFGGLSGVVYALMGYVWLYGEKVKTSTIRFDRGMLIIAIVWLIAGYSGWLGAIANTAHLVGLMIGLLLAAKDIWILKK